MASVMLSLVCTTARGGGILTNTNQNIAFNRMMSREASIGIDGVYSNPAGVAFMKQGLHLSVNWQMPWQTRTIDMGYPLFEMNRKTPEKSKEFKGHAFVPVIPSIQMVYNKDKWSFQMNFAIGGAGGKCEFDDGLGSLERTVANTAMGISEIASGLDAASAAAGFGAPGLSKMFPNGTYDYDGYMRGRQYYYGLSLGAAYKITPKLAVFAGLRGVYGSCTYSGYIRNIAVDGIALSNLLNPHDAQSADISLHCDQKGTGITPILGIDFKTGRWNFSARYEFKTRIRLKNKSVNQTPDISALPQAMAGAGINPVLLQSSAVQGTLQGFAGTFSKAIEETLGEYGDGKKIAADIPALLTFGAGYEFSDKLRANIGFHFFDDKNASQYGKREKTLSHGTIEWNAGVEADINKLITVSAGWQNTNYGMTDEYMKDSSFSVDSNSLGFGACLHLTDKMELNVAYFRSFYKHYSMTGKDTATSLAYTADFTRNNNVVGIGLDIHF